MLDSHVEGAGDELTDAKLLFGEALRAVVLPELLVLFSHRALVKFETDIAEWLVWGESQPELLKHVAVDGPKGFKVLHLSGSHFNRLVQEICIDFAAQSDSLLHEPILFCLGGFRLSRHASGIFGSESLLFSLQCLGFIFCGNSLLLDSGLLFKTNSLSFGGGSLLFKTDSLIFGVRLSRHASSIFGSNFLLLSTMSFGGSFFSSDPFLFDTLGFSSSLLGYDPLLLDADLLLLGFLFFAFGLNSNAEKAGFLFILRFLVLIHLHLNGLLFSRLLIIFLCVCVLVHHMYGGDRLVKVTVALLEQNR